MVVGVWFYHGASLVKEVTVFLKGGESGRMFWGKGDIYGGGYSPFFFVSKNMDIRCSEISLLIVNFNHIDVTEGIHMKLVIDGGF